MIVPFLRCLFDRWIALKPFFVSIAMEKKLEEREFHLAQVIDEVRVLEKQLAGVNQAHFKERQLLLNSLEGTLQYVVMLEKRIIGPSIGSIVLVLSDFHEASKLRSSVIEGAKEFETFGQTGKFLSQLEAPASSSVLAARRQSLLSSPVAVSVEDAYILACELQAQNDELLKSVSTMKTSFRELNTVFDSSSLARPEAAAIAEKHAAQVSSLQTRIGQLEGEVQKHINDRIELAKHLPILQQADELHANHETVLRLESELSVTRAEAKEEKERYEETIAALKQQLHAATRTQTNNDVDEFLRKFRRPNAGEDFDERAVQYETKIKTFELTIAALNQEVASLEDKLISSERSFADERRQLRVELVSQKTEFETSQKETDSIVTQLSVELDNAMNENVKLKQRLRQLFSGTLKQ